MDIAENRGMKSTQNNLPDFIGIGAMRCGTTWISDQLKRHPEIYIPPHFKEVHYFDQYFEKGLNWYLAKFSGRMEHQLAGEFTPYYMRDEQSLRRISQTCPQAKLIITLRHPVDRAFSHYNFMKNRADISDSFYDALHDGRFEILKAGLYGQQIQTCLDIFPSEKLHIIIFDEIKSSPQTVMADLFEFLGVEKSFTPDSLGSKSNAKHAVKSMSLARVLRKVKGWVRPYFSGRHGLINQGFFKIGKMLNRLNSQQAEKRPMDEQTKAYLNEYYREDLHQLNELLNGRVSHWLR